MVEETDTKRVRGYYLDLVSIQCRVMTGLALANMLLNLSFRGTSMMVIKRCNGRLDFLVVKAS